MHLFKISNPSDEYTIKAPNLECATIACLLLGQGKYGFDEINGNLSVPIFLLGGYEEWIKEKFNTTLEDLLDGYQTKKDKNMEMVNCLNSCLIGSESDRDLFELAVKDMTEEKKKKYLTEFHDKKRSSMNDIGGRAWKLAEKFKELIK